MSGPQYVFKPTSTDAANIKKEVCAFIVNICAGSQIVSYAPAAEPFAIGDVCMSIVLKNPSIYIITDNPALEKWYIKLSLIVKMFPDIKNKYITRKGPMRDKTKCVVQQIQRIRMQERLNGAAVIVDTINLYKRSGWHMNASDDSSLNFERIYRLRKSRYHKAYTGTRWDLLYRLGIAETKPKPPVVPHSILIVGDDRLKYTPRCPHRLEGLFFACWVSHINTPLTKLPPGDGYCLACSENIKNYEQIAVMDIGPITADYLESIGIDDKEHISVVLDLLTYGTNDDTGNVLVGREWNFLRNITCIYNDIPVVKTSRYIGKKVVIS